MVKVSIMIPVYNVEKYLEECLESAVNQTLKEIEIIAVNDGSTDNSLNILEKYELKYDNFKIINQENKGLSAARNTGLRACSGKYVYFLDSDDFIDINAMEYCYKEAEKYNLDILTFDAKIFFDDDYESKNTIEDYDRVDKLCEKVMRGEEFYVYSNKKDLYKSPVWLNFYNRDYIEKNHLYFYDGVVHEDEIHTLRSYILAERIKYTPKAFFYRRIRKNSITTAPININRIDSYYVVVEEFYKVMNELNINEDTKKIILSKANLFYSYCIRFCDILGLYDKRNFIKNKIKERSNILDIRLHMQLEYPTMFYLLK